MSMLVKAGEQPGGLGAAFWSQPNFETPHRKGKEHRGRDCLFFSALSLRLVRLRSEERTHESSGALQGGLPLEL